MKPTLKTAKRPLLAILVVLGVFAQSGVGSIASAQSFVNVELRTGEIRCLENTILMRHVAEIRTNDARLKRKVESLDLDSFDDHKKSGGDLQLIEFTKSQIRYRLLLSGLSESQFEIAGPDRLVVVGARRRGLREIVRHTLHQQLAEQYLMAPEDLSVVLDQRFSESEQSVFDYSTLKLQSTFDSELPLGNQQVLVRVDDGSGKFVSQKIPVAIALIRDLAVAKKNISQGETMNDENIESVRRPVASRNVRFASFEQVVGKQTKSDVQQYDLIKSNVIQTVSTRNDFAIKRNALVSVVVRRGGLTVVLKDAKAMENGNPGDRINLVNSKTKEPILAIVIDSKTAEVRY